MSSAALRKLIHEHDWFDIPTNFATREGTIVDSSGQAWVFSTPQGLQRLDFERIHNPLLRWSVMRRVHYCAQTISSHAGASVMIHVGSEIIAHQDHFGLTGDLDPSTFKQRLVDLMNFAILEARRKHRLWALYRPIRWYVWCCDNFPELGFCEGFGNELDGLIIPGNPKGEAVLEEDPEEGPLDRTLELPLLIHTLRNDSSKDFHHLQEKAAVAIEIAIGRNPTNLVYLDEADLKNITEGVEGVAPCWVLSTPRIKKGQLDPRDDFRDEPLDDELAQHILALIRANRSREAMVLTEKGLLTVERKPLFMRRGINLKPIPASMAARGVRVGANSINKLLKTFVRRHRIISPITNSLLAITPRRMRYTLATGLVEAGISPKELARILDHTDTQHVGVYFDLKSRIVRHLDSATAIKFADYLKLFKGTVVDSPDKAHNGERADKHLSFVNERQPTDQEKIGVCGLDSLCALDPPYSCYLCPKFQPLRSANHQRVLDCILESREQRLVKYETARLGILLDDVIFAVAQVVSQCQSGESGG